MAESTTNEEMFKPISGDESAGEVTEIESLCVNCMENVSVLNVYLFRDDQDLSWNLSYSFEKRR